MKNSYQELIEQTYYFPQEGFNLQEGFLDHTCQQSSFDGDAVRRDGLWREMFEGTEALDSFVDLVDLVISLQEQVERLQSQVDNLVIDATGWDEERVKNIETQQQNIINGDVVFERINCKSNVTAYVEET